MKNWQKFLTKYFIEFNVIVLGISTSYLVENFREEREYEIKEKQIIEELISEFKIQSTQLNKRKVLFEKDYRIIKFITSSENDFSLINEDVSKFSQIKTSILDMRYFSPPRDIYNSIVNEGLFKYLKSDKLKIKLNKLYQSDYEYLIGNIDAEGIYLDNIIFYVTEKHPALFSLLSKRDEISENQIKEVVHLIRDDEVLVSKLKIKENKMRIKLYLLNNYMNDSRDIASILDSLSSIQ